MRHTLQALVWNYRTRDGLKGVIVAEDPPSLHQHLVSAAYPGDMFETGYDYHAFDRDAQTSLPGVVMGIARRADIPTSDLFEGLAPNTQGKHGSSSTALGDGGAEIVSPLRAEHSSHSDPEFQDATIKDCGGRGLTSTVRFDLRLYLGCSYTSGA